MATGCLYLLASQSPTETIVFDNQNHLIDIRNVLMFAEMTLPINRIAFRHQTQQLPSGRHYSESINVTWYSFSLESLKRFTAQTLFSPALVYSGPYLTRVLNSKGLFIGVLVLSYVKLLCFREHQSGMAIELFFGEKFMSFIQRRHIIRFSPLQKC